MRNWLGFGSAWLVSWLAHRLWRTAPPGSVYRALGDGVAHAALAAAAVLPMVERTREPRRFLCGALLGSLALDLDHVVAARSLRLEACMTMPQRPPTHSVLTVGLATMLLARCCDAAARGAGIGLLSHLGRDLVTGGVPLWHPRRVVALPEQWLLPLTLGLGLAAAPLVARLSAGVSRSD